MDAEAAESRSAEPSNTALAHGSVNPRGAAGRHAEGLSRRRVLEGGIARNGLPPISMVRTLAVAESEAGA